MRLTFHSSLAMVALMSGQVCEALRLGSIGAVFNNAAALDDPVHHGAPGLANLGQVATYDDEDSKPGMYDAFAQADLLEVDWDAESKKDAAIKKSEVKAKEADLKKKELDLKE